MSGFLRHEPIFQVEDSATPSLGCRVTMIPVEGVTTVVAMMADFLVTKVAVAVAMATVMVEYGIGGMMESSGDGALDGGGIPTPSLLLEEERVEMEIPGASNLQLQIAQRLAWCRLKQEHTIAFVAVQYFTITQRTSQSIVGLATQIPQRVAAAGGKVQVMNAVIDMPKYLLLVIPFLS